MTTPTNTDEKNDISKIPNRALVVLLGFVVVGAAVIVLYAALVPGKFLPVAGTAIMVAGASLFMGGFFGFLFGIPRSVAGDTRGGGQAHIETNTNLVQVSDWLTKILLGAGLTQLVKLPSALESLAGYFEKTRGLGSWSGSGVFGLAIMLAYLICGFLIGYLWTIIFMRIALGQIESLTLLQIEAKVDKNTQAMEEQARQNQEQAAKNASALQLVDQQLNPPGGLPPIKPEDLKKAVQEASASTRVSIFSRAREKRREGWFDEAKRPVVKHAIPVFEALIAAIEPSKDYLYYGELGFALKDQDPSDWAASEKALTEAIAARNIDLKDWKVSKWPATYEANRVICRIYLDANFANSQPAADEAHKAAIVDDLRIAKEGEMNWVFTKDDSSPEWSKNVYQDVLKWMELNGVTMDSLG